MPPLARPSPWQRSRELLLGRDLAVAFLRRSNLRTLPRGDGSPVILVPGFGAGDGSLLPLRRFLVRLGHDARAAGLGRVGDDVASLTARVVELTRRVAARSGRPPALVGQSIGGVLAREAARQAPDAVRQVVTMGTPAEGGPSYTVLAALYSEARLAEIRAFIDEAYDTPITVPVTAIWSPNDGVVNPAACIDRRTPGVEHVEVAATHLGMGVDPTVWAIVARRLAAS